MTDEVLGQFKWIGRTWAMYSAFMFWEYYYMYLGRVSLFKATNTDGTLPDAMYESYTDYKLYTGNKMLALLGMLWGAIGWLSWMGTLFFD